MNDRASTIPFSSANSATTSSTGTTLVSSSSFGVSRGVPSHGKNIESAVYGHIQALRSLGKTHVNTQEIAEALNLSVADVNSTLESLKRKGIKVLS